MNIIDFVEIEGFRGGVDFSFRLHPDVNFFIGRNGTGKTTLVNLLHAGLNADLAVLYKIPFRSLKITLKRRGQRNKPAIMISKDVKTKKRYPLITYKLRSKSSEKWKIFDLSEFGEEEFYYRSRGFLSHRYTHPIQESLQRQLSKVTMNSWLTVHRETPKIRGEDDEGDVAPVDAKIRQITDNISRYFLVLETLASKETDEFQQSYFLSLIHRPELRVDSLEIESMNLEQDKASIERIFEEFEVDRKKYRTRLNRHYKEALKTFSVILESSKKQGKGRKPIVRSKPLDLFSFTDTLRLHRLVEEWDKLNDRRSEIFEPRDIFLKIVNEMLLGKHLFVGKKSDLLIRLRTGERLNVSDLSSGEKQLLILFGEALLQERKTWIYMADEPELSLHIDWQVELIPYLRSVNKNGQIIFATHSPDIVGGFSDRAFDMEKLIK